MLPDSCPPAPGSARASGPLCGVAGRGRRASAVGAGTTTGLTAMGDRTSGCATCDDMAPPPHEVVTSASIASAPAAALPSMRGPSVLPVGVLCRGRRPNVAAGALPSGTPCCREGFSESPLLDCGGLWLQTHDVLSLNMESTSSSCKCTAFTDLWWPLMLTGGFLLGATCPMPPSSCHGDGRSSGLVVSSGRSQMLILATGRGNPQQPISVSRVPVYGSQFRCCCSVFVTGLIWARVQALSGCSSIRQNGSKAGSDCTAWPSHLHLIGPSPNSWGRSQTTGKTSMGTAYKTLNMLAQFARRSPRSARNIRFEDCQHTPMPRTTMRMSTSLLMGNSQRHTQVPTLGSFTPQRTA
mmetsp:Transcript_35871/g.100938  ORF Transcript_35871/g.100938 Transcript_35871/m.100938 type:complete len:353 (+) Transcript_35871:133-1191(+)